jgi:hypothetical protein
MIDAAVSGAGAAPEYNNTTQASSSLTQFSAGFIWAAKVHTGVPARLRRRLSETTTTTSSSEQRDIIRHHQQARSSSSSY